jgi:hypothetical protein
MRYLFILAIVVIVILLYRKWAGYSRRRFLERFTLPSAVLERARAKLPPLSSEQEQKLLQGLLQYFQLCVEARGKFVSMPSQAVDVVWHEFILFTRLYEQFCRRALGQYLHHTPAEAMPTRSTATDGIRRAWRLSCKLEGINSKKPQRLPLLFALDAELGIAGGFIYALDCKDAMASASGAYCASDIGGCGGSSGGDASDGDGGGGCGCGGGD